MGVIRPFIGIAGFICVGVIASLIGCNPELRSNVLEVETRYHSGELFQAGRIRESRMAFGKRLYRVGEWVHRYPDGTVQCRIEYNNHGEPKSVSRYAPDGTVVSQLQYDEDGTLVGDRSWYSNGTMRYELRVIGGATITTTYDCNGRVVERVTDNDIPDDPEEDWDNPTTVFEEYFSGSGQVRLREKYYWPTSRIDVEMFDSTGALIFEAKQMDSYWSKRISAPSD